MLTYNVDDLVDAETLMTLSGQDPYNDPADMTIRVSTDFAPNTGYSDGEVTGTFIALEDSAMTAPVDLFTDEDLSTLTFITEADGYVTWPTWLTFTEPTTVGIDEYAFSGIYPDFASYGALKTINITITATDTNGLTGSVIISILISSTCHSNCDTCSGKAIDECTSCDDGRYLYLSTCTTACPFGTYGEDSNNE